MPARETDVTHREVKVVPHDPSWTAAFENEAAGLRSVLGEEAVAVHHIGSTSVPNLQAKPTIDLLVEARQIGKVDDLAGQMAENGYGAWGEHGIPGRRFFTKSRGPTRTHNIHVFEAGSGEVERHLAFRDYLREHPGTARLYGQLKEELARKFPMDIESYMEGKDAFVKAVEKEALHWSRQRNEAG